MSLLVEGPPSLSPVALWFCFSFVSWPATPHKDQLAFGGGRVELLVWVALFVLVVVAVVPPYCSCLVGCSSLFVASPPPVGSSLSDSGSCVGFVPQVLAWVVCGSRCHLS